MDVTEAVKTYVVDSWPVMEWLQERDPAYSLFDGLLETTMRGEVRLIMSRINFGEVLYSCWKLHRPDSAQLFADAESLPIDLISVDDELVEDAARLKSRTTASYADCFAAALALRHSSPVITGDFDFRDLLRASSSLKLHWLGQ